MAGLRLRSAARSDDSVHVDRAIDYDPHDTVDDGGGYHGGAPYYHPRADAAAGAAVANRNDYYDNCPPYPPCN